MQTQPPQTRTCLLQSLHLRTRCFPSKWLTCVFVRWRWIVFLFCYGDEVEKSNKPVWMWDFWFDAMCATVDLVHTDCIHDCERFLLVCTVIIVCNVQIYSKKIYNEKKYYRNVHGSHSHADMNEGNNFVRTSQLHRRVIRWGSKHRWFLSFCGFTVALAHDLSAS